VPQWEDLLEYQREIQVDRMTSVLDEGDLAGLMRMANLADRDFTAERASARVIYQGPVDIGMAKKDIPEECKQLPIPERPAWHKLMRKDEVDTNEKEAFLNWRRTLAEIEEKYDVMLTPFEKNLEFWRQLWRVVEKSDVVVQVFFFTLVTGPRRFLSLKLSDTRVYEPQIRARLGTTAHV